MNLFTIDLYEYLVLSLKASYESVRKQAFEILLLFPKNLDFLTSERVNNDLSISLENSKNLIIKIYESSALFISFLFQRKLHFLTKTNILNEEKSNELYFLSFLINKLDEDYIRFENSFLKNWSEFYKNSCHGLLTLFSYLIDVIFEDDYNNKLASILKNDKQLRENYKKNLSKLMQIMEKILNFATKILADNVSTVAFDNKNNKETLINEKSNLIK